MKPTSPVTVPRTKPQRSRLAWSVLGLLGAGLWGWHLWPGKKEHPSNHTRPTVEATLAKATLSKPMDRGRRAEPRTANPATPVTKAVAHTIHSAHSEPSHVEQQEATERPHPHPIDDQRRHIYRENNLSFAMMGAMNVGDYQGLRTLIEEYRTEYPEDEYQLQEGYSLVADCLERLTNERQAEAREYWQTNRASIVRRFIRRHCLEKPVVEG